MQTAKIITDKNMQEIKPHGTIDFPFAHYYNIITSYDNSFIDWHWHSELEWVYVEKDTTLCFINGEKILLEQGDGIFINRNILHAYKASGDAPMPTFLFAPDFLAGKHSAIYKEYIYPIISADIPYIVLKHSCEWQSEILTILSQLKNIYSGSSLMKKMDIYALALHMWNLLFINTDITKSNSATAFDNGPTQKRIQDMIAFIKNNYASPIKLDDIVHSALISKSEALRCFHSVLDTTPVDYLIRYRLDVATKMLKSTTETVSSISIAVGFENPSYFCRAFRKVYNMSPAEYRNSVK